MRAARTPDRSGEQTGRSSGSCRTEAAGPAGSLYRTPASAGSFANPVEVTELDTSFNEDWPYLAVDGLTVFWSSTRTDGSAKGSNDIWSAHRTSLASAFSTPTNVQELNTSSAEEMGSLTP